MSRNTLFALVIGIALILLYWGAKNFVAHFPKSTSLQTQSNAMKPGSDTLFQFIKSAISMDSTKILTQTITEENPFRTAQPIRIASTISSRPKLDPPLRKFMLRGTVGRDVATITDHAGRKRIVKIGDAVDSAEIVSIEPNRVVLKDRAGKFELLQEK